MKKPDSIDQMWKLFVERVGLQNAPPYQHREMEMAFKAGCAALLIEMKGPVTQLTEDAAVNTFTRWEQEIREFLTKRLQEYRERGGL